MKPQCHRGISWTSLNEYWISSEQWSYVNNSDPENSWKWLIYLPSVCKKWHDIPIGWIACRDWQNYLTLQDAVFIGRQLYINKELRPRDFVFILWPRDFPDLIYPETTFAVLIWATIYINVISKNASEVKILQVNGVVSIYATEVFYTGSKIDDGFSTYSLQWMCYQLLYRK